MKTDEFNDLKLKGAERINILLEEGTVINGILLNNAISHNKILIYNLGKKNKKEITEEYIALDSIQKIQIIQ